MEKDNEIDQLFKNGLSDPEIPFNELDWEKMAQKLDAHGGKRIRPLWLFIASGIAAALTICLFWYLFIPKHTIRNSEKVEVTELIKPVPAKDLPFRNKDTSLTIGGLKINHSAKTYINISTASKDETVNIVNHDSNTVKEIDRGISTPEPLAPKIETEPILASTDSLIVDQNPSITAQSNHSVLTNNLEKNEHKTGSSVIAEKRKLLTLSVMAAPDVSAAKLNMGTKLSTNIGLLATYAFTSKISITTGAIYSRKLYNSGGVGQLGSNYMKNAWEVDADCIVLDIPLNVNYTFLKRKDFSIGVNSGLSSYFMLNERYKYISGQQGTTQKVSEVEIRNQNQHLLGVANLSLTFERRITQSLSLGIQPFIKFPLTGIGHGNARLKSTGLSFSLNLGLFPRYDK